MSAELVPEDHAPSSGNPNTYEQNGRQYGRKYEYLFPCDQLEMDKIGLLHNAVVNRLDKKLYTAPVNLRSTAEPPGASTNGAPPRATRQVLDLGTGTGLWATAMAESYPGVQIFAVDLFDFLHPRQIWKNTWFCGHVDIEKDWDVLYKFLRWAADRQRAEGLRDFEFSPDNWDLIYARMLNGSIKDRPALYRKIFEHLTPGVGYVELVEIDWTPRSDDNTLPENSSFASWVSYLYDAMDKAGRDMRVNPNTCNILREQGFVDVREKTFKLYHNPWLIGRVDEQIGRWFNLSLTHGLQGMSMAPFTRYLGWERGQVDKFVEKVRHEICLLRHHGYCTLHVWTAGRPPN